MEGHKVTIEVRSKTNDALGYIDEFYTAESDPQMVKYQYHKYTNENYPDVDGAEGSHTLHINGDYPQVQRLLNVTPIEKLPTDGMLPLRFI